jgi:hypothetical protein
MIIFIMMINATILYFSAFGIARHFHFSLILVGKVRAYPLLGLACKY